MIAASKVFTPMNKLAILAKPSTMRSRRFVVRSAEESTTPASETSPESGSTVFYGGKNYSAEEWKDAVANGTVSPATEAPSAVPMEKAVTVGDLMAFSGPAPEIINGRLAMLAFIAALGAELSSGESVLRQWADEPTGVALTFLIFSAASIIPMLSSTKREAFGPFTPSAEMTNGRAAMLGFAALLVVEAFKGNALF